MKYYLRGLIKYQLAFTLNAEITYCERYAYTF